MSKNFSYEKSRSVILCDPDLIDGENPKAQARLFFIVETSENEAVNVRHKRVFHKRWKSFKFSEN